MSLTTGFTFRFGLLPSSVAASGWDDFFLTNCRETARALLLVGIFWPDLAVLEGLPRVRLPEAGAVRRRPSDRGKTDGNFERFPQCFGPFICTWPVVSDLLDPDPYSEFRLDRNLYKANTDPLITYRWFPCRGAGHPASPPRTSPCSEHQTGTLVQPAVIQSILIHQKGIPVHLQYSNPF